jgi:hypothetical protein
MEDTGRTFMKLENATKMYLIALHFVFASLVIDRLSGLVVRVPGDRSRGPDLIPGATRFSEK